MAAPVPVTPEDMPLIAALNFAAMTCLTNGLRHEVEPIVDGTVELYGRLLPTLICRYALRVVSGNLDAVRADAELDAVFTPDELAQPVIRLIRLSLVVTQLARLPGHEAAGAQAQAELRVLAADETQEPSIRQRANSLLQDAAVDRAA